MNTPDLLQVQEVWLRPGEEWMDSAPHWRLLRVASGAAYWLSTAGNRALAEAELMVLPPVTQGMLRASQIGEVLVHTLAFGSEALDGLAGPQERRWLESSRVSWQLQFLPSTHPLTRRFAGLVRAANRLGELSRRAEALSLIAAVLDQQVAQHSGQPTSGPHPAQRFEQLAAQLPDSELIQHSVAGLARLCGCSPRHFTRLFRDRFGESVRTRQTELRLLKARDLLGRTDQKISELALACGYRNASLFNLLFKRRFGLTPTEWRQRARRAAAGNHAFGDSPGQAP